MTAETADTADTAAKPSKGEPGEEETVPVRRLSEEELERHIEALLFIAEEPVALVNFATATQAPVDQVHQALLRLANSYDGVDGAPRRSFELREVGGGWRIYVRSEYDTFITEFLHEQNPSKLSQAALETLAVIAYRQPITRGAVSSIRAVNVDSVVRTLLGRGLIQEAFTDSETGAIYYETTELLLTQLGINSLDELPPIAPLLPESVDAVEAEHTPLGGQTQ